MTTDVLYDDAAMQLEQELRRQFSTVKWRVPNSLDLLMTTILHEDQGIPGPIESNRIEVWAERGQRGAMVPVSVELVRHELGLAAKLTMQAAIRAMDKVLP